MIEGDQRVWYRGDDGKPQAGDGGADVQHDDVGEGDREEHGKAEGDQAEEVGVLHANHLDQVLLEQARKDAS